jgi:hypothetical protein
MFVTHAAGLETDEYERWRDEKELMVIELAQAADKKEKGKPPFMKGKDKKGGESGDSSCASENPFAALLAKHRSESGQANPDTMNSNPNEPTHLINQPSTGDQPKSGVSSTSLKTPRHKIAGSAGNDPLDSAEADEGINLAGASASDDGGSGESPFRTLASLVAGSQKSQEKDPAKKPGFDPVQ